MKNVLPISRAALLAGCVSMGTNYDPNAVAELQRGMSKEDVIARLGNPTRFPNFRMAESSLGGFIRRDRCSEPMRAPYL